MLGVSIESIIGVQTPSNVLTFQELNILYLYYTIKAETLKVWSIGTQAEVRFLYNQLLKVWLVGTWTELWAFYIINYPF